MGCGCGRGTRRSSIFGKAGSNIVESVAILMAFAAVPHERWAGPAKRLHDTAAGAAATAMRFLVIGFGDDAAGPAGSQVGADRARGALSARTRSGRVHGRPTQDATDPRDRMRFAVAAVGFALLTQIGRSGGPSVVVSAYVILSLGLTPVFTMATDVIVGLAPPERAGMAAALSERAPNSAVRLASPCWAASSLPSIAP